MITTHQSRPLAMRPSGKALVKNRLLKGEGLMVYLVQVHLT